MQCNINLTVCSCHVTYAFESESTLYSCLNVKELLARSRREIWRWSDCNWTRTQNHLVLKRTLNSLAKWLSVRLRTKWFWVRVQLQSLHNINLIKATYFRKFNSFRFLIKLWLHLIRCSRRRKLFISKSCFSSHYLSCLQSYAIFFKKNWQIKQC